MFRHDLNRDYQSLFRFLLFGFDIALVVLSGILAHYLRFSNVTLDVLYWQVLGFAVVISLIVFRWLGLYEPLRERRLLAYIFQGTLAILIVFGALSVFTVMTKISIHYSRIWLGEWFLLLWAGFILSRLLAYGSLAYLRFKGLNLKRIAVIGTNQRARDLVGSLRHSLWTGIKPVLFFSEQSVSEKILLNIPVRSLSLSRLFKMVKRANIDEVWIVLPLKEEELIQQISECLINVSITVRYVPDFMGLSFRRHTMTEISGYPLINLYSTPMEGERRWMKAIEDRGLALLFLIMASPVML
ncbi:MAG: hypothetical protein V4496_04530, partial [Pseudomonadota bacterium]